MFLSVWIIYLFDRLFDVFRSRAIEKLTFRHEWARQHPLLLGSLVVVVLGILLTGVLPDLTRPILRSGITLGVITLLYYLAFRFSRIHSLFPRRIPWKEIMIGICFALGIMIAVSPSAIKMGLSLFFAGLVLLLSGNCLLISKAEGGIDGYGDTASHFAGRGPGTETRLPECLLVLSMIAGVLVLIVGGFGFSSIALLACGWMTLLLARSKRKNLLPLMQPLADAIQLLPWLLVGGEAIAERFIF